MSGVTETYWLDRYQKSSTNELGYKSPKGIEGEGWLKYMKMSYPSCVPDSAALIASIILFSLFCICLSAATI